MKSEKKSLAFYSFTACEGCQLSVLGLEGHLKRNAVKFGLASARLIQQRSGIERASIAFVEGSISSADQLKKLREIRRKCRVLVALGSCATHTCVNGVRAILPSKLRERIGRVERSRFGVYPLSRFVRVDYSLQGCPAFKHEFDSLLSDLSNGFLPKQRDFPVCMECKEAENDCVLLKGEPCLGPITLGGCNAVCTSEGSLCIGCRGFSREANLKMFEHMLRRSGLKGKALERWMGFFSIKRGEEPFTGQWI